MEGKKASDYPQELLDLFDLYVHGALDRRGFLEGAKRFATHGFDGRGHLGKPVSELCVGAAGSQRRQPAQDRIHYRTSPLGNGEIRGYFVRPANATGKLPGILVVHENRGLNPYIEDVARRLGTENFMAFGPDGLTSIGGYPGDDEKGAKAFQQVDRAK
jgi:carboxymethylenebutenolidase